MPVRALNETDWPRIDAGARGTFAHAVARLGVRGRQARVSVPSLGETRVTCRHVGPSVRPPESAARWRIRHRDREGWLVVDALSCLSLVSATLGLGIPRVHRRPTPIEAGVVAATLAALVRAVNQQVTLDLDAAAIEPLRGSSRWEEDHGLIQLELEIACQAFRERVLVQVPPAWIPPCPSSEVAEEAIARQLRLTFVLEVARTRLKAGDWSRADVGDAIVFDAHAAVPVAGKWSLRACCGDYGAGATWDEGGELQLTSTFDTSGSISRSSSAAIPGKEIAHPPDEAPHTNEGTQGMADQERLAKFSMLAAAPLEIVAEVGRLVLRADEVVALQAGSVLLLDRPRPRLVELRIGEQVWAHGELVDVDGELGVRLTEMVVP